MDLKNLRKKMHRNFTPYVSHCERDELELTLLNEQENHLQKMKEHEDKHANQAKLLQKVKFVLC